MANKLVPIKYTSRDFSSIKSDLVEHAKRYYTDTYKDFNEGSFGSLMMDTVAYVGDILSFYLDYQVNESFLDTATEYNNILKIARQMGYKYATNKGSAGIATFYIQIPADNAGNPDWSYAPILRKGSLFSTNDRATFILNEDVRFSQMNRFVVLRTSTNGTPLTYGVESHGTVISGIIERAVVEVGDYQKFLKLRLSRSNIVEILDVFDAEGNEYFEVEHLSQNIIYQSVLNMDGDTAKLAKEIIKPRIVPRRFTVENEVAASYLQFGASSDITLPENKSMIADPGTAVLQMFGKNYISSDSFDPTRLQNNDKFGIAPSKTTLYIRYRYNPANITLNFGANSLINVTNASFLFENEDTLLQTKMSAVETSLEVRNEGPIVGEVSGFDAEELKLKVKGLFSAQNRAVTAGDYKALAYNMPAKYGSIKRVNAVREQNSLKRNLNLFVLCEDGDGYLCPSNEIVKTNLKTWLSNSKMINDSVDILDGKIVNYGIEYTATVSNTRNREDVLALINEKLSIELSRVGDFGEPFFISKITDAIRRIDGVIDVISVRVVEKVGGRYSDARFNFDERLKHDFGTYIDVPLNVVMELKYPSADIKGTIKGTIR